MSWCRTTRSSESISTSDSEDIESHHQHEPAYAFACVPRQHRPGSRHIALAQARQPRATAPSTRDNLLRLLSEPYFVPEGTPFSKQLVQFQRRSERTALVVDEYGDIQGIVTLEDILEEIVGEFTTDPADDEDDVVSEGSDTFLVDATANIREINRSQNWDLPTDGPKTINGLIIERLETIPAPGTCLNINGYPIEIVEADDIRIRSVRVGQQITASAPTP